MSTTTDRNDATNWSIFLKRVLAIVGIVGLVILLSETIEAAAQVVLVLFGGILFGVFLNGLARLLSRWTGLAYKWSLTAVVLILLGLIGGFLTLMAQQVSEQVDQFLQQFQEASDQLMQQLREMPVGRRILGEMQQTSEQVLSSESVQRISSAARRVVEGVLFGAGAVLIIFFVGLYLAGDSGRYRDGLVALFPVSKRPRVREVIHAVAETLWSWLMGQLAAMTIIGVATAIGLWILGVPMPITLGVLTFFLVFIPNIGPIVATIPQSLLAYQAGGVQLVMYVIIFNIVLQTVESYLVTPMIQQYEVELPAAMIITVQVILGYVAGIMGLLFATPLAAAAMVMIQMLYIEDVLGDPSLAPDTSATGD